MNTNIKRLTFTSDGKRKDKINLRNLLNDVQGNFLNNINQNNLIAMKSQRLFATSHKQRPRTMHNQGQYQSQYNSNKNHQIQYQRQRQKYSSNKNNIFYGESRSIAKLNDGKSIQIKQIFNTPQTNRLMRNKSQNIRKLSPQTNRQSIAELKPFVIKQEKIKMKKTLGKINLLANKQIKINEEQELQTIFNFLDSISKNQNHFQQAFKYLTKKLNAMIFLQKQTIQKQLFNNLKLLAEFTNNRNILQAVYRDSSQKVTFKKFMEQIVKEILKIERSSKVDSMQTSNQIEQIREQLASKQQLILKLTKKLKYYELHPSQNIYPQINKLKLIQKQLKKQNQEQIYQIRILNHNLQLSHESKLLLQNKIQSLQSKIADYELQKQLNLNNVEKSSQLKQFQNNVGMLKQMLDKSIIRMSGMKEEYDKLKEYNEVLLSERTNLAKRAAVGFGELTPRPNFKRIFQENKLGYQTVFEEGGPLQKQKKQNNMAKKLSTQNFVQILINKFKNYYQSYKIYENSNNLNKKQQSSALKKKKLIIKKQKDVFQTVMDDVYQTKNQIKKTLKSAQEVKLAYNKQQVELLKK